MSVKKEINDFIGQSCGKITVIGGDRIGQSLYLNCICECGNTIQVRHNNFTARKTKSCGCADKTQCRALTVLGTQPLKFRIQRNNTSGHTGVDYIKATQKWRARIYIKRKVYELGQYKEKIRAIAVRAEAEKHINSDFEKWYNDFLLEKQANKKRSGKEHKP